MSDRIWLRHPETGAVVEAPYSSLPMHRQAGWQELTGEELDELERAAAEDVDAAEAEMREKAAVALGQGSVPPPSDDTRPGDELQQLGEAALAEPRTAADLDAGPLTPTEPATTKDAGGRQTKKGNA